MKNENFINSLPKSFRRNITEIFDDDGQKWLAELPDIVEKLSENWSLKPGRHFSDLSFNYVLPCTLADGTKAVLKIGFPKNKVSVSAEYKLLQIFGGNGVVKSLGFDEENCALLLERLLPGESLKKICKIDDKKSNEIIIGIMRKQQREPPASEIVEPLDEWLNSFVAAENFKIESKTFFKGRDFYRELLAASKQKFLLHGDLHHENILSAEREPFLAIDPRGIIGDIGYEISVFLNNPRTWILEHPDSKRILTNRIIQFSEAFEIEPKTLYKWAYALSALAAFWSLHDKSSDWTKWLALTRLWENMEF